MAAGGLGAALGLGGVGAAARWAPLAPGGRGLLRRAEGEALLRVLFSLVLPCVLFRTFTTLQFSREMGVVWLLGLAHCAATVVAAPAFFRGFAPGRRAAAAGASVALNLGLFAYPLAEAAWGAPGLRTVIVADLANQWSILVLQYVVFAALAPGLGAAGAVGRRGVAGRVLQQVLSHPCLWALYAAIALRLVGAPVPAYADRLMEQLGATAKPLALVTLGVLLEPLRVRELPDLCCLLAFRYAWGLAAAAAALLWLPAAAAPVLAVVATSPIPMLTISYAKEFGLAASEQAFVSTAVNASNIASFLLLLGVSALEGTPRALLGACVAGSATLFGASVVLRGLSPNYRAFDGGSGGAGGSTRRRTQMVARNACCPLLPGSGNAVCLRRAGTGKLPARTVPPRAASNRARPTPVGAFRAPTTRAPGGLPCAVPRSH